MQTGIGLQSTPQLGPPPRRVRFRSIGAMWDVWKLRIALLMLGAVPLMLWWIILEGPIVRTWGRDAMAQLETIQPEARKGGPPRPGKFDVSYSFDIGGGQREVGYGKFDAGGGPAPPIGSWIDIKVLYVWPRYHSQVVNWPQSFFPGYFCVGLFATAFTTGWLIGTIVWFPSFRERRIIKRGVAVEGSVAQKVEKGPKGNKEYLIWYRFPARDGQTWGDKARVSEREFAEYQEGQTVLVVYLAHRPIASVLYEASKYRAG